MRPIKRNIVLNGVKLAITFLYSAGFAGSKEEPAEEEELDLLHVRVHGYDILPILNEEICIKIMDELCRQRESD